MQMANIVKYIKSLWRSKQFRFLIIGVINTLFGLSIFPILYFLFTDYGVNYQTLLVVGWFLSTAFSFSTNKKIVFKSQINLLSEYTKYIGFHFLLLIINLFFLTALVNCLKLNPVGIQLAFGLAMAIISYFFHNYITFTKI